MSGIFQQVHLHKQSQLCLILVHQLYTLYQLDVKKDALKDYQNLIQIFQELLENIENKDQSKIMDKDLQQVILEQIIFVLQEKPIIVLIISFWQLMEVTSFKKINLVELLVQPLILRRTNQLYLLCLVKCIMYLVFILVKDPVQKAIYNLVDII